MSQQKRHKKNNSSPTFVDICAILIQLKLLSFERGQGKQLISMALVNRQAYNTLIPLILVFFTVVVPKFQSLDCFQPFLTKHLKNLEINLLDYYYSDKLSCLEFQLSRFSQLQQLRIAHDVFSCRISLRQCTSIRHLSVSYCRCLPYLPPFLELLEIHYPLLPIAEKLPDSLTRLSVWIGQWLGGEKLVFELPKVMDFVKILAVATNKIQVETTFFTCFHLQLQNAAMKFPNALLSLDIDDWKSEEFELLPQTLRFLRIENFNETLLDSMQLPRNLISIWLPSFRGTLFSLPKMLRFLVLPQFSGTFSMGFTFPSTLISLHIPSVTDLDMMLPTNLQFLSADKCQKIKHLFACPKITFLCVEEGCCEEVPRYIAKFHLEKTKIGIGHVWEKKNSDPNLVALSYGVAAVDVMKKLAIKESWWEY